MTASRLHVTRLHTTVKCEWRCAKWLLLTLIELYWRAMSTMLKPDVNTHSFPVNTVAHTTQLTSKVPLRCPMFFRSRGQDKAHTTAPHLDSPGPS